MRLELASGVALLGWQLVAGAVALTGHADALLGAIDPAWLATVCAFVVTPPPWLVWLSIAGAVFLIILAQRAARLEGLDEDQNAPS